MPPQAAAQQDEFTNVRPIPLPAPPARTTSGFTNIRPIGGGAMATSANTPISTPQVQEPTEQLMQRAAATAPGQPTVEGTVKEILGHINEAASLGLGKNADEMWRTAASKYQSIRSHFAGGTGSDPISAVTDWIGDQIDSWRAGVAKYDPNTDLGKRAIAAVPIVGSTAADILHDMENKRYADAALKTGKGILSGAVASSLPKMPSEVGGAVQESALGRRFLNPRGTAIEDVFRASGPPSDPGFRANVEAAANDLGNAYKRTPIPAEAKGGVINPDMRIRASVDAINNELRNMYHTERATQIARATTMGMQVQLTSIDPAVLGDISKRLSRTLPINDPALVTVQKLMADPAATLSAPEVDSLGRAVNTMLRDFESMTPAERTAAGITRRMAGLRDLDRGISTDLNGRLRDIGLPGLEDYERRYAAMSSVRDGLERGMNKAEAARWSMRLREFFSPSGLHGGVTSNLTVSPGRRIESGMRELSKTSTPTEPLPAPPQPAGLLPAPPTEAGWNYEGGALSAGQPRVWTAAEQADLARRQAAGVPSPPPAVGAAHSVEVTRPEMKFREGMTPGQEETTRLGPAGKAGTRTPIRGLLPAPPIPGALPPAEQVGGLPSPPESVYRPPGVKDTPMWTGEGAKQKPPEGWSKTAPKAPLFFRSEAAPLARKYGLIPREPSSPGLVSFQDSTTGGSIEMKDGFTEDQLAAKVKAHRDAMAATSEGGKSDLQAAKRDAATSRFAHEAAPASGMVKAEMGKLKLFDLVTPRQQTTLETMMRGPRWKSMEAADRSAAIKNVLAGGKGSDLQF